MNQTPLQKSIAEIEAMIAEVEKTREEADPNYDSVDVTLITSTARHAFRESIRILTANLEYERGEIMKAFEFSANLKTDLSASDYYTKTYEHERKD